MALGARLLFVPVAIAFVHAVPSVAALGQWTPLRTVRGWCRWRGPDTRHVALTFDDGPDRATTPLVLDRLDALGLRATFFDLGDRVHEAADVLADAVLRGHEIGLHGFAHAHHLARTPRWVLRDLDAGLEALADCGIEPRWYRPPYGQLSLGTMIAARRRGLGVVHWSAWGREWDEPDADAVAARVCRSLEPGAIVLLHDSDDTSPPGSVVRAADALDRIADELRRRDLTATTLSDLVACAS